MSPTEIANYALLRLGNPGIDSFDENSREGQAVRTAYSVALKGLLRSHAWSFATARTTLSQLSEAPAFGWSYAYQKPTDCLRVLSLNKKPATEGSTYAIEGEQILTDQAEAQVIYIQEITDPDKWDDLFVEAFTLKLAVSLAMPLSGSVQKKQDLQSELELLKLPEASLVDSNEGRPEILQPGTESQMLMGRSFTSALEAIIEGINGEDGANGWSPQIAIITDGDRRVQQIVGWTGGDGDPPETGYVSPSGIVQNISDATDLSGGVGPQGPVGPSGPRGIQGERGEQGIQGIQGPAGVDGVDGVDGEPGDQGETGADGADGADGEVAIGSDTDIDGVVFGDGAQLSAATASEIRIAADLNTTDSPTFSGLSLPGGSEINVGSSAGDLQVSLGDIHVETTNGTAFLRNSAAFGKLYVGANGTTATWGGQIQFGASRTLGAGVGVTLIGRRNGSFEISAGSMSIDCDLSLDDGTVISVGGGSGSLSIDGDLLVDSLSPTGSNFRVGLIHIFGGAGSSRSVIIDASGVRASNNTGFIGINDTGIQRGSSTGDLKVVERIGSALGNLELSDLIATGNVDFSGLPTSDPAVTGRLYNDSGTLKISAG